MCRRHYESWALVRCGVEHSTVSTLPVPLCLFQNSTLLQLILTKPRELRLTLHFQSIRNRLIRMSSSEQNLIPSPLSPALTPPSGVPQTFYEPYTLRPFMTLEIAACIILTTVLLAGRVYTKLVLVKKFSWEDCMNANPPNLRSAWLIQLQTLQCLAGYHDVLDHHLWFSLTNLFSWLTF